MEVETGPVKMLVLVVASLLTAAAVAADPPPTPAPEPPAVVKRPLSLNLDHLLDALPDHGHAEFDGAVRRELWNDPMARLSLAVAREEVAARSGRGIAFPESYSASGVLVTTPGADPRLALLGPWAADWRDLSTQEKIGRIAEGAVYAGLVIGILRGLR